MKKLVLIMGVLVAGTAHAKRKMDCEGIFPKNNLWIGREIVDTGIDEATFNSVLDKVTAVYTPVVQAHQAQLSFNRAWDDGTVNSDTYTDGDTWIIDAYGGLARYDGMTADAYTAVACHELGHHLGGAPQFSDGSGMSVEGEADYHVGTKCLRRMFGSDDNQTIVAAMQVDPTVISKCSADWTGDQGAVALCERSSMASLILAQILQVLDGDPVVAFNTPDPSQVDQTFEDHPAAQCRLDTYFNSSLCTVAYSVDFDNNDYKVGACTSGDGIRPRCWFAPN